MPYMIEKYYPDGEDAMHKITVHGLAYYRPGYVAISVDCDGGVLREVLKTAVFDREPTKADGTPVCRPCPWRERNARRLERQSREQTA